MAAKLPPKAFSWKTEFRRFKYAYWHNPFGYATFWDYWFKRRKGQDILSETLKHEGKIAFLRVWIKIYKHRGAG